MVLYKIELIVSGGTSSPSSLFEKINTSYGIGFVIDPNQDSDYDETVISFVHPNIYGFTGILDEYNEWYLKFLENEYINIKYMEFNDIEIVLNIYYIEQCSFEIFDKSKLKKLLNYNVSIPVNVYSITKSEMLKILSDGNFNKELYIDLI